MPHEHEHHGGDRARSLRAQPMLGGLFGAGDHAEASLATLVSLGLAPKAVARVIQAPPSPPVLDAELAQIRGIGCELEADVLHLVATNPAAADLVRPRGLDRDPGVGFRLVAMAIGLGWIALSKLHPLLGLLVPGSCVVLAGRWFRARRTQLDDREWRVLVDWFTANLPRSTSAQRWMAIIAASLFGLVAVPLAFESTGVGVTFGFLALLLAAVALLPTRSSPRQRVPAVSGPMSSSGLGPPAPGPRPLLPPGPITPLVVHPPPVPRPAGALVLAATFVYAATHIGSLQAGFAWAAIAGAAAGLFR